MPLEIIAKTPINADKNYLTCHVATWYWAAQTAIERKLIDDNKTTLARLKAIATMDSGKGSGPQNAILSITDRIKFDIKNFLPLGDVLLWCNNATHFAVITGTDEITGYNQVAQFKIPGRNTGHTSCSREDLQQGNHDIYRITQATIVKMAAHYNL